MAGMQIFMPQFVPVSFPSFFNGIFDDSMQLFRRSLTKIVALNQCEISFETGAKEQIRVELWIRGFEIVAKDKCDFSFLAFVVNAMVDDMSDILEVHWSHVRWFHTLLHEDSKDKDCESDSHKQHGYLPIDAHGFPFCFRPRARRRMSVGVGDSILAS
jgi:hypothetical protein